MRFLICLCFLAPFYVLSAYATEPAKVDLNTSSLKNNTPIVLSEGFQEALTDQPIMIDLGYGSAPVFFYELPLYAQARNLILTSSVQNDKLFYPIVLLLSDQLDVLQEIKKEIRLTNKEAKKVSMRVNITVEPQVKYLVITTDPSLFGKSIEYRKHMAGMMPIYSGNSIIYIPTRGTIDTTEINFSSNAALYLALPHQDEYEPVKKQQGLFYDVGASFGGEKVAANPKGDNYNAGSGAIMSVGYGFPLSTLRGWTVRTSFGLRYQGGEGESQGIITQAAILYSTRYINLGAGIYGDLANSIKDIEDRETKFENAFGPALIAEWRASAQVDFGLKYIFMDYQTKQGVAYKGNKAVVYINIW